MSTFNHTLPRRTFLRGLGATMALPLLDSMGSRITAAGPATTPIRLGYVYTPNGIIGASDKSPRPFMWTPKTAGANFEFSPTMKALEPYRDHVNVFSGLAQVNGRALGDGPGDHARATATFLTGVHPYKTGGADFNLGISADQIAAKEFGKYTQLSSLEIGLEPQPLAGNCDSGYTCAYMSMSWRGPTSPLPAEINPRMVFERLFGDGDSTDPNARMARLEHQKSVLDYVTGSLSRLRMRLGTGDKRKLEEYLEAVRDIERRIQRAEEQNVMVYAIGLAGQNGAPAALRGIPDPLGRSGGGGFGGRSGGGSGGGGPQMEKPDEGLPKIAAATGGGYFELTSARELPTTFARVANELHHQYALGFTPEKLDGKMHDLTLHLSQPELMARARKRYLASKAPGAS